MFSVLRPARFNLSCNDEEKLQYHRVGVQYEITRLPHPFASRGNRNMQNKWIVCKIEIDKISFNQDRYDKLSLAWNALSLKPNVIRYHCHLLSHTVIVLANCSSLKLTSELERVPPFSSTYRLDLAGSIHHFISLNFAAGTLSRPIILIFVLQLLYVASYNCHGNIFVW